jgi:hypothetical protein
MTSDLGHVTRVATRIVCPPALNIAGFHQILSRPPVSNTAVLERAVVGGVVHALITLTLSTTTSTTTGAARVLKLARRRLRRRARPLRRGASCARPTAAQRVVLDSGLAQLRELGVRDRDLECAAVARFPRLVRLLDDRGRDDGGRDEVVG